MSTHYFAPVGNNRWKQPLETTETTDLSLEHKHTWAAAAREREEVGWGLAAGGREKVGWGSAAAARERAEAGWD